jgi:4-hydroxybenzoate polyprenyltransferase
METILRQLRQLNTFFGFFTKKLRLSNPWNYKVPFLICVPYFLFLLGNNNSSKHSFYNILASITIIIGVSGIGYLTNDIGDRKKDALVQKHNVASNLSGLNLIILMFFFLTLVLMPWYYLPFNKMSILLLMFQIFLFCLYSLPPFRLKEKGLWGILTDSLYAHVNPALLAAYTFYLLGYVSFHNFIQFVLFLCLWQFILGIRNIFFHQIKDYENDISSGTNTFVTTYGKLKSINLCENWLLPIEVASFLLFSIFILKFNSLLILLITGYWILVFVKNKNIISQFNFRDRANLFLDNLYIKWLPLAVLTALCIKSIYFCPLIILHFLIFRNGIKSFLLENYTINMVISRIHYYLLKLIGYKN